MQTVSAEETEKLGKKLGKALGGGEVIELISDLGGGKTTFTRGVAAGAGSQDLVSSPTFTISNQYQASKLRLHHFDFYRLHEAGLIEHELAEVLDDPGAVVIVEWSDVVTHVLPKKRLTIKLESNDQDGRKLTFKYPKNLKYLVDEL